VERLRLVKLSYYYFPTSHWSRMVSLCIAEKGLSPERHFVDITTNANFAAEYLRINPRGVVPTLVHNGETICGTERICRYLANFDGPQIQGGDAAAGWADRLSAVRMMHVSYRTWIDQGGHSGSRLADKVSRASQYALDYPDLRDHYERKRAFFENFIAEIDDPIYMSGVYEAVRNLLATLAEVVADQPFIDGESWSKADAAATPVLYRLRDLGLLDGLAGDAQPALASYLERQMERPSFAAVFVEDPFLNR